MKRLAFLLTAVLLFLGFAGCTKTPQQVMNTEEPTAEPSAEPTSEPTEAPTPEPTAEPEVIYGTGLYARPDVLAAYGEVIMPGALSRALTEDKEGRYDNCVFAVSISIEYADHGIAESYSHLAHELSEDEDFRRYEYAYYDWIQQTYVLRPPQGMTGDEIAEELGYDPVWFRTEGEDGLENGYHVLTALFEEQWKKEIPEDEWLSAVEAHKKYLEASDNAWGRREESRAESARTKASECERLQALGLNVFLNPDGRMLGYLTKEQILNFPVNERYGYYLGWESRQYFNKQ